MNIEQLCSDLILSLEHGELARLNLSTTEYIREYRTIGINVPRRVGKTTALVNLNKAFSSLLIMPNYNMVKQLGNSSSTIAYSEIDRMEIRLRGIRSLGLKYTCFLLDEPNPRYAQELANLVSLACLTGVLPKDFFILQLGTL